MQTQLPTNKYPTGVGIWIVTDVHSTEIVTVCERNGYLRLRGKGSNSYAICDNGYDWTGPFDNKEDAEKVLT